MSEPTDWNLPPRVRVPPPGPASRRLAARLARVESRNVTYLAHDFPIFWKKSRGSNVWDADGNRYVDLTAGFGVSQMIAGMLYGIGPRDPVTFIGVPALLAAVGVFASLMPAIRATRTVSFVGTKPGFAAEHARPYVGAVVVADIGAPRELTERFGRPATGG